MAPRPHHAPAEVAVVPQPRVSCVPVRPPPAPPPPPLPPFLPHSYVSGGYYARNEGKNWIQVEQQGRLRGGLVAGCACSSRGWAFCRGRVRSLCRRAQQPIGTSLCPAPPLLAVHIHCSLHVCFLRPASLTPAAAASICVQTMLLTACAFPVSCFSIAFVLNTIAIFYQVGGRCAPLDARVLYFLSFGRGPVCSLICQGCSSTHVSGPCTFHQV